MQTEEIQAEWFDALYASSPEFWLSVVAVLQLMVKAGMPMSRERSRTVDMNDPETVGVYVLDLSDSGITQADVMADGHNVRRMLRFFPSSAELVTAFMACREKREPSHTITGPVYIYRDGAVRVCRKNVAVQNGWEYHATELDCEVANGLRSPLKALPPGTGAKALAATLNELAEMKALVPVATDRPRNNLVPAWTPEKRAEVDKELLAVRARLDAEQSAKSPQRRAS